jgi:ABC-type multidrug transport system fused ATPase/permease subunit
LNALIETLFQSFAGYAGLLERLHDGVEPTRTLVNLLDEQQEGATCGAPPALLLPDTVGIEMQEVSFAYGNGPHVLKGFNVRIESGMILGLVGRSGIGKTTFQQLLSRVHDVQRGRILISDKDVREWPLDQLRSIFSSVTQNGGVFFTGASILNTIRFARPEATRDEAIQAAKWACIHDQITRMDAGYDTRVRQRGVSMSKGQQQRIALAQALLAMTANTKILILDEFTSALDSATEKQVLENLKPLLRNKTVIVCAHRLATLRKIADRIIVLDEDGIVEDGDHDELLRRHGTYAEMAELQTTF